MAPRESKVRLLPAEFGSPGRGLPAAEPGTLFVMGSAGGIRVAPDAGFEVIFGRNVPDVHVCVGATDPHVSRRHGRIARGRDRWVLTNLGRLPIRFPDGRLLLGGDRAELASTHTALFVVGPRQEHLLETRVALGSRPAEPVDGYDADTARGTAWHLEHHERLVLACLSRRYLGNEPAPQPLTWAQVAEELSRLRPGEQWTWRRAAHIVTNVRKRLSPTVPRLMEEEIPPPVGNALNHNLIRELLVTGTLSPTDLGLLEE
ncbi:hypothetical protein Val02_46600 [Virgisporangium aliadipatigenens]|uniref:FHA domain-containing protein n=1 Tax=Virgisporangium aliadipatigenens TaxID=741659 RepID=A0A8J3YLN9_9ACTN|nr:FHA domain-containing protein [Virgisporangium aliadipatigenens]GIJ47774.1 hypothetical protein Val02_46600 [Virgisporangium aliadipatigenens]